MVSDGLPDRARHQPVELLYGYDAEIAEWVRVRLDMPSGFGDCLGLGIVQGGRIIAGIVYYCYRPPNIEMAVASITPRWATRKTLKAAFAIPFQTLNCSRVTALVDTDAPEIRRFDERLGFVHEGTLRQAHPNGDAEVYGMLKSECRWI